MCFPSTSTPPLLFFSASQQSRQKLRLASLRGRKGLERQRSRARDALKKIVILRRKKKKLFFQPPRENHSFLVLRGGFFHGLHRLFALPQRGSVNCAVAVSAKQRRKNEKRREGAQLLSVFFVFSFFERMATTTPFSLSSASSRMLPLLPLF
jgi:hypothetical protein